MITFFAVVAQNGKYYIGTEFSELQYLPVVLGIFYISCLKLKCCFVFYVSQVTRKCKYKNTLQISRGPHRKCTLLVILAMEMYLVWRFPIALVMVLGFSSVTGSCSPTSS